MKNNGKLLGLLSGLFWGMDTVLLSIVLLSTSLLHLGNNASLLTTFIHDSFSFLLLMTMITVRKKHKEFFRVLKSKAGLTIILAALLGGPIGMSAYIVSIKYLGASLGSSISAIYPVIGMILAYFFMKEKIRLHNVLGILISITAIILMGASSILELNNLLLGLIFSLVCAISWGSEAVIINAALKEDVSSDIALAIRQMTTMLTYGLIVMPLVGYHNLSLIFLEKSLISIVLLAGLLGTISYLFYYKAIDFLGSVQAMGLNISYPAWAFIFEFLIFKTFDSYLFLLSLAIIFGAILSNDNPKEFLSLFKKDK